MLVWRSYLIAGLCLSAAACDASDESARIVVMVGSPGMHAAELAAADIHADDRADSVEVDLVPGGYNVSAEAAIDIARVVSADPRTIAVIGHNNSATSMAAAQIYNREHVVQIAPTSTAAAYAAVGPYSFSMVPPDQHQARMLAEIARQESPNRRIAIGYANDDYGRGLLQSIRPLLSGASLEVVMASPHREATDSAVLRRFAADVRRAQPDLLLWLGRAPALAVVLAAEPGVPVVGSDGVDLGVVATSQHHLFEGVRYTRFVDPSSTDPRFRHFVDRYQAMTGSAANAEAIYVYDAIGLLASLIRNGADTRKRLQRDLAAIGNRAAPYRGIGGDVAFDDNGDMARPYQLALVTDSGVVAVPIR